MSLWTLVGLRAGKATTSWPKHGGDDGQAGVLGMPRYAPERCQDGCRDCAAACLPGAIQLLSTADGARLEVDYGRCIACQLCTEVCPTGAFTASHDWAFSVRHRLDLVADQASSPPPDERLSSEIRRVFGRSLHVRHVDGGSCNGCESELQALNNPFYNLHRLGVFFTASPRFADLLLVTGSITYAMRPSLLATYEAMPEPRFVMAVGACAISGGAAAGTYAAGHGLEGVLPVDIHVPGCPPNPAAIIEGLLLLLGRQPQRVHAGHVVTSGPTGAAAGDAPRRRVSATWGTDDPTLREEQG